MKSTKIEWTDKTWNPITGCSKISTGCMHCYAETMAYRLKAMGQQKYANGFSITLHDRCLIEPLAWKGSHNIFVCSMSDIFHEEVPYDFVDKMFEIIRQTPQHRYQILTKRADRMASYFASRTIPNNVWLGVTVEAKSSRFRIDYLRNLSASVKLNIRKQVEAQGARFFFKQWGTWGADGIKRNKHANGKLLNGELIQEMPM